MKTRRLRVLAAFVVLTLAGCQQKMSNQPRYDPLEPSEFFQDGMSARPRLPNTVARGDLANDQANAPAAVTLELVNRGQSRYNIYCTPCHGQTGDGNGMIPARGYRRPPSFHTLTVRERTDAHYFDVMTNGFGSMPPYRTMIGARDRWAIVAYIRALQLSQNVTGADLTVADRAKLGAAAAGARAANPAETFTSAGTTAPKGGAH